MKSLKLFYSLLIAVVFLNFSANAQLAKDWDECKWLDIANEQQHFQFIEQYQGRNDDKPATRT